MAEGKKGLSTLAWVGIGCGVLVILAGIAVAVGVGFVGHKVKQFAESAEERPVETTAKLFARVTPDVEYVSSDEAARTVVLRNTKTGEEMTFDFEDIEQGRIRWNTGEGEVEIDTQAAGEGGGVTVTTQEGTARIGGGGGIEELPAWVPVCAGYTAFETLFINEGARGRSGSYSVTCPTASKEALDDLQQSLEAAGFTVERQTITLGGQGSQGVLTAKDAANQREVNVTLGDSDGASKGMVQYSEKP